MSNSESTMEELKEQLRQEKIRNHDLQDKVYSLTEDLKCLRKIVHGLRNKNEDLRSENLRERNRGNNYPFMYC